MGDKVKDGIKKTDRIYKALPWWAQTVLCAFAAALFGLFLCDHNELLYLIIAMILAILVIAAMTGDHVQSWDMWRWSIAAYLLAGCFTAQYVFIKVLSALALALAALQLLLS